MVRSRRSRAAVVMAGSLWLPGGHVAKTWLGVSQPFRRGNVGGVCKAEGEQERNNPKRTPFYILYSKTDISGCLSCSQGLFFFFPVTAADVVK